MLLARAWLPLKHLSLPTLLHCLLFNISSGALVYSTPAQPCWATCVQPQAKPGRTDCPAGPTANIREPCSPHNGGSKALVVYRQIGPNHWRELSKNNLPVNKPRPAHPCYTGIEQNAGKSHGTHRRSDRNRPRATRGDNKNHRTAGYGRDAGRDKGLLFNNFFCNCFSIIRIGSHIDADR